MSNPEGTKSSIPIQQAQESSGRFMDEESIVYNILSLINKQADAIQTQITDASGRQVLADGFGNLRVSKKVSQFSAHFGYNLSSEEVIIEVDGTGEVITENSMLKIRTIGGAGEASVESLSALRYIPGTMAYIQFTVAGIPVGPQFAGDTVRIGNYDSEDGFGGASIDGEIYIFKRRYNGPGDIITDDIPQSEWNMDKMDGTGPSGFVYNPTNGNIFEISWIFLGFGPIVFILKAPDDSWVPIHRIKYPNSSEETHISLPYLPARAEIVNTSGNNIELSVGSIDAGIYNGGLPGNDSSRRGVGFNLATVPGALPKSVTGTDYLVAFRGAQTLSGRRNKLASLLNMVTTVTEGAQNTTLEMIFNPDVLVDGTWTRVDGKTEALSETPVEYSIDTDFDLTTGKSSGLIFSLRKVDSIEPFFLNQLNSLLRRGQVAVFKITSQNATYTDFGIGYFDLY
jgi:hypothetical protein